MPLVEVANKAFEVINKNVLDGQRSQLVERKTAVFKREFKSRVLDLVLRVGLRVSCEVQTLEQRATGVLFK